jgi:hypothetical protein
VGQAARARHGQRFACGHAADRLPDADAVTYKTAGPPPDAATFAGPDGHAVSAADRHAAADRNTTYDEPACHRAADPDAHLVRDHVGNALAGVGERGDFAAPLRGDSAPRSAGTA